MKQRLAVIILHYGDPELTTRLHKQLQQSDPNFADLYVLDNNAPLPYEHAWERLPENLYWAGALDHVLKRLAREGFSHAWYLNNDISFVSRPPVIHAAWQRLLRLEKTLGKIGVYSPAALRNPYHPQMVQEQRAQYRRACYVDGIAPLFNLECVRELGGVDFNGNKYGYGVDVALSLAAHNAGWPVVVDHQVCLKHAYHSTARTIDGFLKKAAIAEESYMRRVLGENWRAVLDKAKHEFSDQTTM